MDHAHHAAAPHTHVVDKCHTTCHTTCHDVSVHVVVSSDSQPDAHSSQPVQFLVEGHAVEYSAQAMRAQQAHQKEKDVAMLKALEHRDRGCGGLLAPDRSGRFARLVHQDSFFIHGNTSSLDPSHASVGHTPASKDEEDSALHSRKSPSS